MRMSYRGQSDVPPRILMEGTTILGANAWCKLQIQMRLAPHAHICQVLPSSRQLIFVFILFDSHIYFIYWSYYFDGTYVGHLRFTKRQCPRLRIEMPAHSGTNLAPTAVSCDDVQTYISVLLHSNPLSASQKMHSVSLCLDQGFLMSIKRLSRLDLC